MTRRMVADPAYLGSCPFKIDESRWLVCLRPMAWTIRWDPIQWMNSNRWIILRSTRFRRCRCSPYWKRTIIQVCWKKHGQSTGRKIHIKINQSINRLLNQTKQSNQSINQSLNWSIEQNDPSFNQSIKQSINQLGRRQMIFLLVSIIRIFFLVPFFLLFLTEISTIL